KGFGNFAILPRNLVDELIDNGGARLPVEACAVIEEDAVLEDRFRDGAHIFETGVRAAFEESAGAGGGGEAEGGTGTGAEFQMGCGFGAAGMGCVDEAGDVVGDDFGKVNPAGEPAAAVQFVAREHRLDWNLGTHLPLGDDFLEDVDLVAEDFEFEKEPVE